MIQNKPFHIIIIIIATALVAGFVMYLYHYSELKTEQKLHEREIYSKDTIIANLKARISKLEDVIAVKPDRLPDNLLKIYTVDAYTDVEGVDFCLAVPEDFTVIDKLKMISSLLMQQKFKHGIITLKKVKQQNGKRIAIIELKEKKIKKIASWKGLYFQGSSGGYATTYILRNTILQPDYTGKWIDGVEFWYEGKPISNDWDHIFLHGTMYRSKE